MVIEKVKIGSITLDPTNARRHDEENIESLKRSLVSFGQQKPIVVNKSGVVVAGNGFLSAALALGWKHVMVVRTDLTPELAQAYAVADNRLSELSQWDTDALNTILQSLL